MPYAQFDIEVTRPLPALSLAPEATGLAVLVRRRGRPVAFWMEAMPGPRDLAPDWLAERISQQARAKLLKEQLRDELRAENLLSARAGTFPSLTIAICTKDRPDRLRRCLESIRDLPPLPGAEVEVLVVDNAPSDAQTREVVAAFPGVRYVCEPRPGLDFARNRALAEATGDLLAYLDDDVTVDAGWLAGLAEAWAENPDAGAFTGLVLPFALETPAQILFEAHGGFRRGLEKLRYHGQTHPGNPLYPCGAGIFGAGANMAFRRDVLRALGGFDEALDTGAPLPGGGDLDIFYRVIRAGHPLVYEPAFLVFHEHRRELDVLRRQYASWGLGFMAFVTKTYRADPPQRPKLRRLVRWWFAYQAKQLAKSLLGRHPLPPGMIPAELRGGVRGLLGEYGRSQRRVAAINAAHAGPAVPAGAFEEVA